MATQFVNVCTEFGTDAETNITSCLHSEWIEAYVIPTDLASELELLLSGGFDSETFLQFFGATIVLFCVGFGVGICLSNIRKIKSF